MVNTTKYIVCLTITIISILALIIDFSYLRYIDVIFDFRIVTTFVSIGYSFYMLIYECKNPSVDVLREEMISEPNTDFMVDTYARYLFPLLFATFILTVNMLFAASFRQIDYYLVVYLTRLYIGLVLPFFGLLELYSTDRRRVAKPFKDVLILLIICFGFMGYEILFKCILIDGYYNLILPTIGGYINILLYILIGYVVYDFILHKKSASGDYVPFKSNNNERVIV